MKRLTLSIPLFALLLGGCSKEVQSDAPTPKDFHAAAMGGVFEEASPDPVRVPCEAAASAITMYQAEAQRACTTAPEACEAAQSTRDAKGCLVLHRCEEVLHQPEQRPALLRLQAQGVPCSGGDVPK